MALEKWVNAQLVLDGFFFTPWPSLTNPFTTGYTLSCASGAMAVTGSGLSALGGYRITCNFTEALTGTYYSDCDSFTDWFNHEYTTLDNKTLEGGEGTSTVFNFQGPSAGPTAIAMKDIGDGILGDKYTAEVWVYLPVDASANSYNDGAFFFQLGNDKINLIVRFGWRKLWIPDKNYNYTEVVFGPIGKSSGREKFKFVVDSSHGADNATVDVWHNNSLLATGVDCSNQSVVTDGLIWFKQELPDSGTHYAYLDSVDVDYLGITESATHHFSITGSAANFTRKSELAPEFGTFLVTGTNAGLSWGRDLDVAAGTFEVSGSAAGLYRGSKLVPDAGAYAITGSEALFSRGYGMGVGAGAVTIAGMGPVSY